MLLRASCRLKLGGIGAAQVRRFGEHFASNAARGIAEVSRTHLPCAGLHLPCSAAEVAASTTLPARCRRCIDESAPDRHR